MKCIKALILKQKNITLYCFIMNAVELEPLCFVDASSRNKKEAVQRVTENSRLKEIGEYIKQDGLLPNNIILNYSTSL